MKALSIIAFAAMALAQILVPAKMIWDKEKILDDGTAYKFRCAALDPNDPFRGKYITLRFDQDDFDVDTLSEWERGQVVYVMLGTDEEGFAKIVDLAEHQPLAASDDYVKAEVGWVSNHTDNWQVHIKYPFTKFYMEESKAYEAELAYREAARSGNQTAYALVNIKNGKAVLKDVLINHVPIVEVVEGRLENKGS